MKPVHTFQAGTTATRYELVGVIDRTTFGELLFSTTTVSDLCSMVQESNSQGQLHHIYRYSEIILIKPGQRRPMVVNSVDQTWFFDSLANQEKQIDTLLESIADEDELPRLADHNEDLPVGVAKRYFYDNVTNVTGFHGVNR